MAATYVTDGVLADTTPGQDLGGCSTGIGVSARRFGPANQSTTSADFSPNRIGGSAGFGSCVISAAITAGSGYTSSTTAYTIVPTGGGGAGAEVAVLVTAGAIASATVTKPGSGYTSAPTVSLTSLGAGTGGAVTLTIAADGRSVMLGAAYGTNKGGRYLTASATVANGAAVSGGYLNRTGSSVSSGDSLWCVAP
ncbi:hypothetical protein UFOVP168_13 [uncultured Caudovirales phage]|uniref:Uncharacterized protein n=1 Tax=uncultured Caudovirales phage TaxID=2100421 RepID=A0A6J7WBZ4_9CAUD|nr:hypothetical protein UFOVP168_13 [uncultured Caudovirales phage]